MAFEVDENSILHPLGVQVAGDSRSDILPATRDYFETIPGMDGEFDFGAEFEAGALELHCIIEVAPADWPAMRRQFAAYLDPRLGTQTLIFADEPGVVYYVRYSGKIPLTKYPYAREFTIPFRLSKPFIVGAAQKSINIRERATLTLAGIMPRVGASGTAINAGTEPAPFTVTMYGPLTNPSVTVAGYTMAYTGEIVSGSALIIDTGKMTAVLDGANALPNYNGVFPKIQPGPSGVVGIAGGVIVLNWFDHWI